MSKIQHAWLTAGEASRRLDVNRATLYAYVSRGFVRSQPSPASPRERIYSRDDVERLLRRTEARRAPDQAAAHALQWGLPILESSIALIDGQKLYYRGIDAAVLAQSRSLEEVASLIWTAHLELPHASIRPERRVPVSASLPFVARAQSTLAAIAAADPRAVDLRPASVAHTGFRVLRILTGVATRSQAGQGRVHATLTQRWRVGDRGADLIRAALVLCADHELNVSSFAARTVASAGSHPYAVVIAGLAALEGPKHGGAGARVESMLDAMRRARSLDAAVAARLRRGESIDGFGHPLYRAGDPRARLLLDLLGDRYPKAAEYKYVAGFVEAVHDTIAEHPNLDFALAAVSRVLQLPAGAPLMLFAIGRSVGWIGHAMEQYATGLLIRPRAKYVGVSPVEVTPE